MTLKEMYQLKDLNKEILMLQERIDEMETSATSSTQKITGMPFVSGASDKVGEIASAIADEIAILECKRTECMYTYRKLNRYIQSIDDCLTRQIMTLRFINGLPWKQVILCIGGISEDSAKKACYRYLKKN